MKTVILIVTFIFSISINASSAGGLMPGLPYKSNKEVKMQRPVNRQNANATDKNVVIDPLPTIYFVTPTENSLPAGTNMEIRAMMSDISNVVKVVFLVDGLVVYQFNQNDQYLVLVNNVGAGNYVMRFDAILSTGDTVSTGDYPIVISVPSTVVWNTTGNSTLVSTHFLGTMDNQALRIRTNNIERMTFTAGGNIGVGTQTPQAPLDVNGNIFSSGKVAIGTTDIAKIGTFSLAVNGSALFTKVVVKKYDGWVWPDYVFGHNYELTPLKEVEQFIKANRHLPEVPSASDVEKNGIDLGDNQAILLKKIEELTLYVIAQGKQLDEQNRQIKMQQSEIGKLKTKYCYKH